MFAIEMGWGKDPALLLHSLKLFQRVHSGFEAKNFLSKSRDGWEYF